MYFKDFHFSNEKHLLFKAGEVVSLKTNQLHLLEFFLNDTESVHSKDDILSAVWGNQDVSEQVVFQTISQLRSVLGSDAIKTYPKRGYRWTLDVSLQDAVVQTKPNTRIIESPTTSRNKAAKNQAVWLVSVVFFAVLFTISFKWLTSSDDRVVIHHIEVDTSPVDWASISSEEFVLRPLQGEVNASLLFSSPQLAHQQAQLPSQTWLLATKGYASDSLELIHYSAFNGQQQWQGYVQGATATKVSQALQDRIEQLQGFGMFTKGNQVLTLESVRALLQDSPDDPELLLLASKKHTAMAQNDVALAYLQRVVATEGPNIYKAVAYWKMGRIYKMRGQSAMAHQALETMGKVLSSLPLTPLYFEYIKTKAWLAYSETNHAAMYQALEQGFARFHQEQGKHPLSAFKLHILTSILSQKVANHESKYHHLTQAQALLIEHQLDASNYAVVYYHYALFAKASNPSIKDRAYITFLNKVLTLPRTSDNFWVHDEVIELLVLHHLAVEDFTSATQVLDEYSVTPKRLFLRAKVQQAQNQAAEARALYERAYQQAKIDYDTRTALESALILYRLSSAAPAKQAEYLVYLQYNAQEQWLVERLSLVSH